MAKVNWIFDCLIELYLIKVGNQVFLIDKAEYPFGLMEFLMLINFNLVVPKRVEFCEMNRSGIDEICLDYDKL